MLYSFPLYFALKHHFLTQQAQIVLQRELLKVRAAMEISANRRRRPAPPFLRGQKVWLMRRHIATIRPCSKLDVRRLCHVVYNRVAK